MLAVRRWVNLAMVSSELPEAVNARFWPIQHSGHGAGKSYMRPIISLLEGRLHKTGLEFM
jgi:hypothetical protein